MNNVSASGGSCIEFLSICLLLFPHSLDEVRNS